MYEVAWTVEVRMEVLVLESIVFMKSMICYKPDILFMI